MSKRPDPADIVRARRQQALAGEAPAPMPEGPDKALMGDGPWQREPDRVEWVSIGYPCVIARHPYFGTWAGYVGVPVGHPWHGLDPFSETLEAVEVHGGVTFAELAQGQVRSLSNPRAFDAHWWVGFDCAHGGLDLIPLMESTLKRFSSDPLLVHFESLMRGTYRDVTYAGAECELIVRQAIVAAIR